MLQYILPHLSKSLFSCNLHVPTCVPYDSTCMMHPSHMLKHDVLLAAVEWSVQYRHTLP